MKYLRLKKKKDFTRVLKNGKRVHTETLTLVYLPAEESKFAVCVGKKHGKSVQRNRIKRLLREALRTAPQINAPLWILLMPKVAEEYSFAAFQRDIGKIFKREKLVEN